MNAGVRIVGFWWEGSSGSLGSFGSLGRVVLDSSRLSGASGEPDESGELSSSPSKVELPGTMLAALGSSGSSVAVLFS